MLSIMLQPYELKKKKRKKFFYTLRTYVKWHIKHLLLTFTLLQSSGFIKIDFRLAASMRL